ncbi:MAG TPA: DUF4215 domain-containing protein [Minicystis sp.]|nr:DUF4215 domain-containing protein [Minicystis sp.]
MLVAACGGGGGDTGSGGTGFPTSSASGQGGAGGATTTATSGGGPNFTTSHASTGAGMGAGGGGGVDTTGCGDGIIQPGEQCDDGNDVSGDGCSADCKHVEQDYACPTPGQACVSTVHCGDGIVSGQETCDDGNTQAGDGCSSDCQLEAGWQCPSADHPCIAAACGDGIVAGGEGCDDGNTMDGDGCSAACTREAGWACPPGGGACHQTVCGDGVAEGDEGCDDGNQVVGDGCSPDCTVEPQCPPGGGACHSQCGDGIILPSDMEACDDGNASDGDGCSATCTVEPGWTCTNVSGTLPDTLDVPITFRDVVSRPLNGATRHPDFEIFSGSAPTQGLVATDLGMDGKPVYTGICDASLIGPCPYGQQTTTQANFDQWYRDTPGVNITYVSTLSLNKQPNGTYYYPTAAFFPLDNLGWMALGDDNPYNGHNFGFTSEIETWFQFGGGESLQFSGDDDVWVFINDKLALDLGGLHPQSSGSFVLDAPTAASLGLVAGNVYQIDLFHAERHTDASNFNLTLGGFVKVKSSCVTTCGDGIVAGKEQCDDGTNDGSYGTCNPDCTLGPRCGDAQVQTPEEECDDGVNLSTYSFSGMPGCAPGCKLGGYCGDGKVQSLFGEACDDGTNDGSYGGCNPDCTLGPRCGDGIVQHDQGEQCDDGNTVSGDGCSATCKSEGPH